MGEGITRELFDCIPEIEFNIGYRYFLGNMENYLQALLSMLKSIKAKLPLLEAMYRTGEYTGLRTVAQTLQRMMNKVGAVDMAERSYQLEVSLLNDLQREFNEQLDHYIRCLYRFSDRLESLFQGLDLRDIKRGNEEQPSFLKYDFTKTMESIKRTTDLLERRII